MDMMFKSRRQKYEILRGQLEVERSSFMTSWREGSDYLLPRRARFTLTESNRGDRRNQKIIDSTATLALRTLRSGMMSGVTNKARPWFRLTTTDPDLAEMSSVKEWLHKLTTNMFSVLLRSNFYKTAGSMYSDLAGFGTGAVYFERDMDRVIHTQSFPIGSYMIAADSKGRVNVFIRDFRMTVRQLVEKFGDPTESQDEGKEKGKLDIDWEKFSLHVRKMWEEDQKETWIDVCHVILPNDEYDPKKGMSKYKKFRSCYYERGTSKQVNSPQYEEDVFLSEMGYDYFPVLCPRWETTGEDVYGTSCPGIDIIGDTKALQLMQRRKAEAIEKMNRPPMTGPTALKSTKASILPGDITFVDEMSGQSGFRPAFQVDPRIQEMLLDIQDHQSRIKRGCFEDLFLMISQDDGQKTAYEVSIRNEEKLTVLGPVLENLDGDFLDPAIDILFHEMMALGLVEDPPDELRGQPLKVEYISIMHQAMKSVGVAGIERYVSSLVNTAVALKDNSIMMKVDLEQYADVLGDGLGVNPSIIRSDEKVAEMKAAQAKAQQQQQQAEQAQAMAASAKNLAGADMSGDNALTRLAQGGQGQVVQ